MRRMRHIKAREFQGCDVAYDFSNPSTLYDATSGGSLVAADGAIARAEDLSGNGNHVTQSASGSRPTRKVAYENGIDAALFDGTADYLTGGDVADILDKPVTVACVIHRTGGSGTVGFFAKARAANSAGRWGLLRSNALSADSFIAHTSTQMQPGASYGSSTSLQVLAGVLSRNAGASASSAAIRQNGTQYGVTTYTDTLSSYNANDILLVGAYNDSAGTGVLAGSYLPGTIGEAAKWQAELNVSALRRFEHSRMRKWRISG